MNDEERFLSKVEKGDGCWLWLASVNPGGLGDGGGYGRFQFEGRVQYAHRVAYQLFVGPIPEGLVIDHLCRNRACVNPYHLEPVSRRENNARGENPAWVAHMAGTCTKGHPYTTRWCSVCDKERKMARRAA